jgi:SOS-response transcriptional repressor LexA
MSPPFTPRQGEYLAFIHRFTARRGMAPSFEEIGAHFDTTAPSVNSMIKMLESRGLLSRVPGVARSLRVVVPSSLLPGSEFGASSDRSRTKSSRATATVSPVDAAVAAVTAAFDVLLPEVPALDAQNLVQKAVYAVQASLNSTGLLEHEALEATGRLLAEAARWAPDGRGISVRRRQWTTRSRS